MSVQTAPLTNSRRRYEKRTYTPLIIADPTESETTDALGLAAMVRALMISDAEFTDLRGRVTGAGQQAAVDAMRNLATAVSGPAVLAAATSLARIPTADLRSVSDTLRTLRAEAANTLIGGLCTLDQRFNSTTTTSGSPVQPPTSHPSAVAAPPQPVSPSRQPEV